MGTKEDHTGCICTRRNSASGHETRNEGGAKDPVVYGWAASQKGGYDVPKANKDESSLKNLLTPSIDEHQIPPEEFEGKGMLDAVAARIVLKLLYLARVG